MKIIKTLTIMFCLSFSLFNISSNNTYAAVIVKVTEQIPGGNCSNTADENGVYTCTVEKGFDSVMDVFSKMIKYATLIASLAGVLFIVINGIALSASGVNPSAKDAAKGRIIKTLIGLIILLLSGIILSIIAPWVYR